jgi:Na+/H+ antiporter NhaC
MNRLKSKLTIKISAAVILFIFVCGLAAWAGKEISTDSYAGRWYSIVPALLAIVLAFLTRRVFLSLGLAVLVGGLLMVAPSAPTHVGSYGKGIQTAAGFSLKAIKDKDHLQILAFFPPMFSMIAVLVASGGFRGILHWLSRWIRGRKSVQAITAFVGLLYFIDDYSNTLIVGSMMRPVTDRYHISREKLSFLVDATSAPITGLAVISTWIVFEVGLFAEVGDRLGIAKDGYSMFFDALGFRFYCVLMILFVFIHIIFGRDFGTMKTAEDRAQEQKPAEDPENDSPGEKFPLESAGEDPRNANALNAILPLAGLVVFHFGGLWVDGGGIDKLRQSGSIWNWVYWREVIAAAEHSSLVLIYATLFGLTLALLCGRIWGRLSFSSIGRCFQAGLKKSAFVSCILILAWSLKNCCEYLETDTFLAALLAETLSPVWFPALLFLVASVTSFATGTSWGTMAILIPTAIPLAFTLDNQAYGLTTMISLGAVLDGAIFGDHCSPISDTTIISSHASSCDLMQHVRTQLPYSLFVAVLALLCGYIPSALGLSWSSCIVLAGCVMAGFFITLSYGQKKRTA